MDIYIATNTTDIYKPTNTTDIYKPTNTTDIYIPTNATDIYIPTNTTDINIKKKSNQTDRSRGRTEGSLLVSFCQLVAEGATPFPCVSTI